MTGFVRHAALQRLASEQFDLLVVGGGITGSGIAREATLRGLRVALVEARDFASGTSSRSTRLIHGGLRYLRQGEVRLVREAVRERELLLGMAPHLVRPLPFLFPVFRGDPDALSLVRLGVALYQRLGGLPVRSRHLLMTPNAVREQVPLLRSEGLRGGALYEDALTDDARLTLAVAQSAAGEGAAVANYCRVLRFLSGPDGDVRGAEVRDEESGAIFPIMAERTVIAAGAWTDRLREGEAPLLRLTKGVHLTLRREDLPLSSACVVRGPDGRLMFAIPDGPVTYVGTTDTDVASPGDDSITSDDAEYIFAAIRRTFPDANISPASVIGAWSGVRPLVRLRPGPAPSQVSRDYRLVFSPDGLVYVVGGKLTAFRAMAERIIDRVFPNTPSAEVRLRSRRPLAGGEAPLPHSEDWRRLARTVSVPEPLLTRELAPYGAAAPSVLADLPAGISGPPQHRLLRMRLRYAVREEMALHLTDVLQRRTDFLRFSAGKTRAQIAALGQEMALLQGWSEARQAAEVAAVEGIWRSMFQWRRSMGGA
ncbi:MAG: glycerol-3-phosphate dehydrogenase/oxidase [Thermaerobacter sp.]|nr:glycerol-3-phosphate dehydrogenase/oxidase [Thermaerobacter sp.]